MATTDLHVHVFPFDYFADRPSDALGLARTAGLIARLRAEGGASLLFDNGDFLQGSPLGDYVALETGLPPGSLHPMIAAMNRVGYDAVTLGNHEFNFGIDFLMAALAGAEFPVVSANVATAKGPVPGADTTLLPPAVLIERTLRCDDGIERPLRVGVIGFLPPQTALWDRDHMHGRAETRDIVETARAHVPRLRAAGADLIVALAHSGIEPPGALPGAENAATDLALAADVDVVIAGHAHQVFPGPRFAGLPGIDADAGTIGGKPAVMAGCNGSHLGVIDLDLCAAPQGWRVTGHRARALPIAEPDADGRLLPTVASEGRVLAAAARGHAAARHYMSRPLGTTDVPLATHLALLVETPALRLVCEAQRDFVERMLQGTAYAGLPVLSAAAPFKVGGRSGPPQFTDIPAGPLTLRNLTDLYGFPNVLRVVLASGAEIAEWLERSAAAFARVVPDEAGQTLFEQAFPSYNFDMIAGLRYRFDLSQPARYDVRGALVDPSARRVEGLTWNGRPLDPAARFAVATNNYRVAQLTGAGAAPQVIAEAAVTNRDVLVAHVERMGRITAGAPPAWHVMLPRQASGDFLTAPAARSRGVDVPGLSLEEVGPAGPDLVRLRLGRCPLAAAAE